jgi:hypothetical protein
METTREELLTLKEMLVKAHDDMQETINVRTCQALVCLCIYFKYKLIQS